MPARSARCSTASGKERLSTFSTNLMTSPPSAQEKQYHRPRAGVTLKDGVFSSWNGHSPLSEPPPALRSWRYSPITSAMGDCSRTIAMSSSRIRPATHTPRSSAPVAASLVFTAHTLRVRRAHGAAGFRHACYRRRVRWLLVLWDIDFTLINAGGVGTRLYRMVFRDMFGTELPSAADMAGRTDRAIVLDTLARAGIPEPRKHLDQFLAKLAALAPTGHELAVRHSRALPGAAAALDALAAFAPGRDRAGRDGAGTGHSGPAPGRDGAGDGATDVRVVQSVLTGNVRRMAEIKLSAVGLDANLDLETGAYGDSHEIRSELVHLARDNAARKYGRGFAGTATVLVGDTPLDVAAARATGARAVAVATGGTSADKLAESGADAVLPDLTDTPAVLSAILGHSLIADDNPGR